MNGGANLAYALERKLFDRGYLTHVVAAQTDGSVLLELAQNVIAAGLITICSADFLYEVERERAQALVSTERFVDFDASLLETPDQAAEQLSQVLEARGIKPLRVPNHKVN